MIHFDTSAVVAVRLTAIGEVDVVFAGGSDWVTICPVSEGLSVQDAAAYAEKIAEAFTP